MSRPSPVVAPELLGCYLLRRFADGSVIRSRIVETEAYAPGDPACHAYKKQTPRNAVMFGAAGYAYIYLIYGMYHCFNVVTDAEGLGSAVLIRAVELMEVPAWFTPTGKWARLGAGPGKLCRVLGIDRTLNGIQLNPDQPLWLEIGPAPTQIIQTTRIGISQGVEMPWRWYDRTSPAVSKPCTKNKLNN